MVDMGTCCQLCDVIRAGTGQASAARCLKVLRKRWLSWAGYPTQVVCDRGLHNRGIFQEHLTAPGVSVHHAPLETPEAIGRVEGHGGDIQASRITEISTVVTEACIAKNELHRHGGYSPSQWVLGKMPNTPPSVLSEQSSADLGAIEDQCDPESKFTLVHEARAAAKRAYVHLDCSKRVQRALLRNAQGLSQ